MMKATTSRVHRIAIAGNGIEAWLTASALATHLDGQTVEITVIAIDGSDEWDSLYTVLPAHPADVVSQVGIADTSLIRQCNGSFSLGAKFCGPRFTGDHKFKPYGPAGIDYGGSLFHNYWLLNSRNESVSDYFAYSPAARAMSKGVFAPPAERNMIGPLQHEIARHVDTVQLTQQLRSAATRLGVTESLAPFQEVRRVGDSMKIDHLLVTSGERVAADLFIDCSGPRRSLLLDTYDVDWISASTSENYGVSMERVTRDEDPSLWHTVEPLEEGWNVTIPLGDANLNLTFLNDHANEQAFVPGHVSRPWIRNCVAVGHSAFAVLPIDNMQSFHLMTSIERLITLLPGPDTLPAETLEYNQLFLRDLAEIHDLMAVHQLASKHGTINDNFIETGSIPQSLQRRLRLFSKRGWVSISDSDVVPSHLWSAVLLFYGLIPKQHDLLAERVQKDALRERLGELSGHIDKVVSEFPPYEVYLKAARGSRA